MIAPISRHSFSRLFGLPLAVLVCVAAGSCNSSKKNAPSGGGGAYASYPADGHYNPYPTGSQGSQGSASRYQEYTEAPPPPPEPKPKSKPKPSVASAASGSSSKKSATKKSATPSKTASSKSGGTVHVVKRGDSLYSLAKKYHTTISKIKSANGLKSDLIRDGQKLRIP